MSTPSNVTPKPGRQHKRTTSAKLKSIIVPGSHKRSRSTGEALLDSHSKENCAPKYVLCDIDFDHAPLGEITNNIGRPSEDDAMSSPDKENKPKGGRTTLHKRSASSKSLKDLMMNAGTKEGKNTSPSKDKKIKKTKSGTNISGLLSRSKASKGAGVEKNTNTKNLSQEEHGLQYQENVPPPIYAQFASQPFQEPSNVLKVPLNDRKSIDHEVALYTPQDYSPSKQRNFYDYQQPTLVKKGPGKPRPKSTLVSPVPSPNSNVLSDHTSPRQEHKTQQEITVQKRSSKVMAAVAALNRKTKETESQPTSNANNIESEFEALLNSRNVPQTMREKLRGLDTKIKADFVQKDKLGAPMQGLGQQPVTPILGAPFTFAVNKPNSENESALTETADENVASSPTKRSRGRSRTFTLSRDSSPLKKSKQDGRPKHSRTKSSEYSSAEQRSISPARPHTPANPGDFVTYLQQVQQPEVVEVGRLHKLRLLLRNEAVNWVERFVSAGGMKEIIGLLHRIMEVEWREEHEDQLLHETLLCLKALCTTDMALQKLLDVQDSLFPALVHLIFDEERKGPSEYSTRGIVFSLLFTHLAAARSSDLSGRACTILSYLRDPSPPEEERPPGFITSMHQSRPFSVWCKEVSNVSKEVFWIFLHHLNVVPMSEAVREISDDYASAHFPKERPPVPAAPYVGGVEWEATNYLGTHLDLINGLIASLKTGKERNDLRTELRASGFERVMGGSLRTCKEKFYGSVHDGLRTWVEAASEDDWDVKDVRLGPKKDNSGPVAKSPVKKKMEAAPKLDVPKVDLPSFNLEVAPQKSDTDAWI